MSSIIGIDVGGTTVKLALVRTGARHQIVATSTIDTLPNDPGPRFAQRIAEAARALVPQGEIVDGAGVGCPGIIDDDRGIVVTSANLPSLKDFPLADEVGKHLGVPVSLQNDAKAAVLGEYLFGTSSACRNFVLLTLGTGVGGGVIANGRLLTGADNGATELGHVKVDFTANAPPCGCGRKGCLEAFLGIQGIARIAKEVMAAGLPTTLKPNPSTKEIGMAAQAGDAVARDILHRVGTYLGRGIANFVEIFNPEKVVLAGGASRATPFLMPGIRQSLVEFCSFDATRDRTAIEATTFPDDINVLGAAAVYLNAHR